uniref:ShKT domain-containing protein n=2 Tax=Caenorhabditis tropicalis TaxID=1561998 RepID=A0A1I7TXP1_9PELO
MVNGDYNCTYYDQAAQRWRYSPMAVACDNILSDSACKVLYPDRGGYPDADSLHDRPLQCYTTATVTPAAIVDDMKKAAIASCPKNCGLCCQTPAYNCSNVAYPRLNCATITKAQCDSVAWRTIIAQDCPASCGFCNQGGCVDAILDCANDISICNTVGMQDFVNTYCQKTCNRCPSTTTIRSIVASACTSYNADSSTLCAAWALNGFCTNAFYTLAQRKAYCARTCRIC